MTECSKEDENKLAEVLNLDRMDHKTVLEHEDYVDWQLNGYPLEGPPRINKGPLSVKEEIYVFLCNCMHFSIRDKDGTEAAAEMLCNQYLADPYPVEYAKQFDPSLRKRRSK